MAARKKKLTPTQEKLYKVLVKFFNTDKGVPYDALKSVAVDNGIKSFEGSFNAIYDKGWVSRVKTNDFSNKFKVLK